MNLKISFCNIYTDCCNIHIGPPDCYFRFIITNFRRLAFASHSVNLGRSIPLKFHYNSNLQPLNLTNINTNSFYLKENWANDYNSVYNNGILVYTNLKIRKCDLDKLIEKHKQPRIDIILLDLPPWVFNGPSTCFNIVSIKSKLGRLIPVSLRNPSSDSSFICSNLIISSLKDKNFNHFLAGYAGGLIRPY
ncbi:MAG: hypothetical protein H6743_02080 [Rickettsiaceae bacterium]|nr:hypothetical protein [Rickettsiaceae bacterium]